MENWQNGYVIQVSLAGRKRGVPRSILAIDARWQTMMQILTIRAANPLWHAIEVTMIHGHLIAVIAGKQFITTIAREGNRHLLPRHAANVIRRQHRGIAKRL